MNEIQPILFFEPKTFQKLWNYTIFCDTEISGMGLVRELSPNIFLCYDIKIYQQTCSPVMTKIESEELAKCYTQLVRRGKGQEKDMNLWWHSHNTMGVFWSPRDRSEISEWSNSGYGISLVVNKRMEYLCRVDIFKPLQIIIPDIKIEQKTIEEYDEILAEKCKKEVKNKVNYLWKSKIKTDTLDKVMYLPHQIVNQRKFPLLDVGELEVGLDTFYQNLGLPISPYSTLTLLNQKISPPNFSIQPISGKTKPLP
jgi:hypothetical protein